MKIITTWETVSRKQWCMTAVASPRIRLSYVNKLFAIISLKESHIVKYKEQRTTIIS